MKNNNEGIEIQRGYQLIKNEAWVIAEQLVKEYPGKVVTKSGVRHKFEIPWVRATDIFKILSIECGFAAPNNQHLKVPLALPNRPGLPA